MNTNPVNRPVQQYTTRQVQNPVFNSPRPVQQSTTRQVQNPVYNKPVQQPTTRQVQNPVYNKPVQKPNTAQDNENIKAQVIIGLEKAKTEQTGIKVGVAFLSLLVIIGVILGVVLGIPDIRSNLFKSSDAGGNAADSCGKIFKSSGS